MATVRTASRTVSTVRTAARTASTVRSTCFVVRRDAWQIGGVCCTLTCLMLILSLVDWTALCTDLFPCHLWTALCTGRTRCTSEGGHHDRNRGVVARGWRYVLHYVLVQN